MGGLTICFQVLLNTRPRFIQAVFYSSSVVNPTQQSKNISGRVVNVAIIGAPNSGKSTLINKIVDRKICAASNKVHTTTKLARAICFENDTQIIFLDTPGVITDKEQKKYSLPETMLKACHKSLKCADVVGVVHDVTNKHTKNSLHRDVIAMLKSVENIPSFLVLNKVDRLDNKKQLLTVIRNLTNGVISGRPIPGSETKTFQKKLTEERGYSNFSDVFLVSALNGDGVKDVKDYLINNAHPAKFHYSPENWSDQEPETLVTDAVRAKFLDFLHQEIPYQLKTELEYYEELDDDKIICAVAVECPSERLQRLIAGAGGGRLQQIKSQTKADLIQLFKKQVILDINLKVKGAVV